MLWLLLPFMVLCVYWDVKCFEHNKEWYVAKARRIQPDWEPGTYSIRYLPSPKAAPFPT